MPKSSSDIVFSSIPLSPVKIKVRKEWPKCYGKVKKVQRPGLGLVIDWVFFLHGNKRENTRNAVTTTPEHLDSGSSKYIRAGFGER